MGSHLVYQIALTMVPNIAAVHAKTPIECYGSATQIFRARKSALEKTEGIGPVRAFNIATFRTFKRAEEEISFIEKYRIRTLFIKDKDYPQRFLNCYDPPTMFYFRGSANLNHSRIIAIVGTRTSSDYGKYATEQLIKELSSHDV